MKTVLSTIDKIMNEKRCVLLLFTELPTSLFYNISNVGMLREQSYLLGELKINNNFLTIRQVRHSN